MSSDLLNASALQQRHHLAQKDYSAQELMRATLDRIEAVNPTVNAICTLVPEADAMFAAQSADDQLASGTAGPLCGIPMAIKDLNLTAGIRTTFGSRAFSDHIPDQDSLVVSRLKQAGALVIGKTNTPEFGAGSHTFNEVFGVTRNPYDLGKCAGGSSGGAAAALASRMFSLADGSDMGGSLRNPAAFCNVVGFRPSMGRVPHWPNPMGWQSRLGIEGPMARNVADCAALLSVMAGFDERDPISLSGDPTVFAGSLQADLSGTRVAWSPDLGYLPVERSVRQVCEASLGSFEGMGISVDESTPDTEGAMDVFRTLRAAYYAQTLGQLLQTKRDQIKDTLAHNIELGLSLSGQDLTRADATRSSLFEKMLGFFNDYDFLVLPTTQVQPFDCDIEWITNIEGNKLDNYLDWMSICCIITIYDLPAISVPCGFTDQGLPVGLQIVGRPRSDLAVLQLASAFEAANDWVSQSPAVTEESSVQSMRK